MKVKITKLFLLLLVLIFSTSALACDLPILQNDGKFVEVEDEALASDILSFDFVLDEITPGGRHINYSPLWGRGGENTYVVEYAATDSGYYLVYLKKSLVADYEEYVDEISEGKARIGQFYQKKREFLVDGKSLYGHQLQAEELTKNVKVFWTENLADIKYSYGTGYRLAFCARRKDFVVKERVSDGEAINASGTTYDRVVLRFTEEKSEPQIVADPTRDVYNNDWMAYEGEFLEYLTEEDLQRTAIYLPMRYASGSVHQTGAPIMEKDGKKAVILPRYYLWNNESFDLLEVREEENQWLFVQLSVYADADKAEFLDAFVEITQTIFPGDALGSYVEAFYDYDKVLEIIKK